MIQEKMNGSMIGLWIAEMMVENDGKERDDEQRIRRG